MSLVGTRPILPDELEQYELHHRARIAIKPGITGMWQVSGRSDITDFEEIVRLDAKDAYSDSKSEIHFRINKNKADLFDKSYAIQFEEVSETIAIWDLRKRLQNNASLDLYTQSVMYWEKINRIYVQEIALNKRNSGITSKLAIMSFSQSYVNCQGA